MSATLLAPVITDATRRDFLALVGAAGLLAACGTDDAPAARPAAATRTVAGGFGDVTIPTAPERVVTMYATDTDVALVLGLTVTGAYATSTGGDFPPYQADRLDGVASLATFPPDFEAIAALAPDLIFHTSAVYSGEEEHTTLSGIAPVFSLPEELNDGAGWRPQLRAVAETFDRSDVAEAYIAAHDERAAALAERIAARWAGATVAYVGLLDPGQFYIAQANMQTNQTLAEDLGLALADVVPATVETRRTDISYEEVGLLADVDIVLLRVNPAEGGAEPDPEALAPLTTSPLWATLPAVRAGNVFTISGDLFYGSPLTATANLDWAEANLL